MSDTYIDLQSRFFSFTYNSDVKYCCKYYICLANLLVLRRALLLAVLGKEPDDFLQGHLHLIGRHKGREEGEAEEVSEEGALEDIRLVNRIDKSTPLWETKEGRIRRL